MVRLALSVCVAIAIITAQVDCGSRMWESSLAHRPVHDRQDILVDEGGYAVIDNITTHALRKRWLAMAPGEGGSGAPKLWPDKTISYCFESQDTMDTLWERLDLAIKAWQPGLHPDVYKYKRVANPGSDCVNHAQRVNLLVIRYNTDGNLATTVGMRPLNEDEPDYKGPTMMLSDKNNVGLLDPVANMAHEIGHAWGLFHEHQNVNFWGNPYSPAFPGMGGTVFGEKFNCQALRDYGIAVQKVRSGDHPEDEAQLCTDRLIADKYDFSASQWLPIKGGYRQDSEIPSIGAEYKDVDWNSIMIYPSGAGGMGDAAPPGGDSDKRQDVLLRNDGARIGINLEPSEGDIAGIKALYEEARAFQQGNPILPNDKRSGKFTTFLKNVIKKKQDSCDSP